MFFSFLVSNVVFLLQPVRHVKVDSDHYMVLLIVTVYLCSRLPKNRAVQVK